MTSPSVPPHPSSIVPFTGQISLQSAEAGDANRDADQRQRCPNLVWINRLMGTNGELTLRVQWNIQFHVLGFLVLVSSLLWVIIFFVAVMPETSRPCKGPCCFSDNQLKQNAIVLFAYFMCFASVRVFMFFPGVAARVAEIQLGNLGFWRMYALHVVVHGPLYIFGVGSILFTVQLLASPDCDEAPSAVALHESLGWFAGHSIFVCVCCMIFAFAHGRLITQSARYEHVSKRRAPPGTLDKLLGVTYTEDRAELFNGENAKFAEQCPICLMDWEIGDLIKICPCHHAFHKDCLAEWLKNERTCAFCRQDVLTCKQRSAPRREAIAPAVSSTVAEEAIPKPCTVDVDEGVEALAIFRDPTPQLIGSFMSEVPSIPNDEGAVTELWLEEDDELADEISLFGVTPVDGYETRVTI